MNHKIVSKFIKDISFEIPNVQTFAMLESEISNYNLSFDIKSSPFKKNVVEVNTILKILPMKEVKHKMLAEINLTALVSVENITDKKILEHVILVDVPTEVYPSLYETFVYLFKQAGVNNIDIKKEVNFEKLYNEKNKS
jgi:preprotein translocase subunit SecB